MFTVEFNGSQKTASCSVNVADIVTPPQPETLSGSCSANTSNPEIGDTVLAATGVTGGNGNYTYSWSGDENLSGNSQSVSRSYAYSGVKSATVTISSGDQHISRSCNTYVSQEYVPPYNPPSYYYPSYYYSSSVSYSNLDASCMASQSSAYVGENVIWSATGVTGGNGNYTYSWTGTDGLYSNSYSVYKTYDTAGTKFAYLTVYSNGQSITRTCSLPVNNQYTVAGYTSSQPYQLASYEGVSLSQVPYTGLESNIKIILFTLALILWSGVVTYIVVIRKRMALAPMTTSVSGSGEAQQSLRQEILMGSDRMLSNLESFARSQNVIISEEALIAIADIAGNNQKKAETLLSSLASRHSTGQDWTILDLNKVQGAIS